MATILEVPSDLFSIYASRWGCEDYHPSETDKNAFPVIQWRGADTARFAIGNFIGHVDFYMQKDRRCRGWWPVTRPTTKTGLFPKINIALREITEKYMNEQQPKSLFVYGDDAKRNDWNSAHYKHFNVPPIYRFFTIINYRISKRNAAGVVGVGWLKHGEERIPAAEFSFREDRIEFV